MAARKQFLGVRKADDRLTSLLQAAKAKVVSNEELQEQRVSFAFGNAPDSEFITKDSVRASSGSIRLSTAQA